MRASEAEKARLELAAQEMHTTRSQFVLQHALDAAERILAERAVELQTRFVLPEAQWEAFCARLDEPERELSNLSALAQEPSPFHAS
ncbi:MAG: DUF1778 domain-containing protein [Fimbriimonadaceae bacterium]|nr:DUF1778 domain-containing protein [Fimbriimonadaceae bacterium]